MTGEVDCYGKQAQELGNVEFESSEGMFVGNLNYVTGYTGFNSDPSEQTGYFLPFTTNSAEEVKMYVSDAGKQVVCDKAPTVNVVFLGATKEIAEKATLKLVKGGQTTIIPMTGITFNEALETMNTAAKMIRTKKKASE